uniref:Uncharacterized protein n=1 Tax=Crocodylus porosus TaxID=8502 RepID=A0A7M4FRY8_CROPO
MGLWWAGRWRPGARVGIGSTGLGSSGICSSHVPARGTGICCCDVGSGSWLCPRPWFHAATASQSRPHPHTPVLDATPHPPMVTSYLFGQMLGPERISFSVPPPPHPNQAKSALPACPEPSMVCNSSPEVLKWSSSPSNCPLLD